MITVRDVALTGWFILLTLGFVVTFAVVWTLAAIAYATVHGWLVRREQRHLDGLNLVHEVERFLADQGGPRAW